MTPYYEDDSVTLWLGHDLEVLRTLPDASVDCCVTSPPYYGLRDYGVDGQRGHEASPAEYVAGMVEVFAEVRRVLTDDGTLWLNLGDSYYSGRGNPGPNADDRKNPARRGWTRPVDRLGQSWGRPKSLLGIPWRVAFALVDDGWTLRNDIIWSKPNAMPESVADRLATRHEHLFLFTKSTRYWFDLDPIREPLRHPDAADGTRIFGGKNAGAGKVGSSFRTAGGMPHAYGSTSATHSNGRNPGDVWSISTVPFTEAHFACMPPALADRCILAGCKPGGIVLDPYSGSGTTGLAAARHGRRYVGIDLNPAYHDLALRTRIGQAALIPAAGSGEVHGQ